MCGRKKNHSHALSEEVGGAGAAGGWSVGSGLLRLGAFCRAFFRALRALFNFPGLLFRFRSAVFKFRLMTCRGGGAHHRIHRRTLRRDSACYTVACTKLRPECCCRWRWSQKRGSLSCCRAGAWVRTNPTCGRMISWPRFLGMSHNAARPQLSCTLKASSVV